MNSAYLSRLRLTSSSKRTCRVVVFGCFDGAFSSAKCFSSFRHRDVLQPPLQNVCSYSCTRAKHVRSGVFVSFPGLERPQDSFGQPRAPKSGVAPAQHGVLPASKFSVAARASSSLFGTCSIAEVTARVTDRVICVCHAPVTSPRWKKRLKPLRSSNPYY